MSLEQALKENTEAVKALVIALGSAGAIAAAAPAAAAPAPKAADKKAETKKEEKAPEVTWKQALDKVKEINASKEPGRGRDGVTAVIKKFIDADGAKVPDLEKLNKHAEVLAFAEEVLKNGLPAEEASDDLGI